MKSLTLLENPTPDVDSGSLRLHRECKADELAKLGSEAAYIGPEPAHGEAKKIITEWWNTPAKN